MSETLITIIIFVALMYFMCGRHGGKGGCCGSSHKKKSDEKTNDKEKPL